MFQYLSYLTENDIRKYFEYVQKSVVSMRPYGEIDSMSRYLVIVNLCIVSCCRKKNRATDSK